MKPLSPRKMSAMLIVAAILSGGATGAYLLHKDIRLEPYLNLNFNPGAPHISLPDLPSLSGFAAERWSAVQDHVSQIQANIDIEHAIKGNMDFSRRRNALAVPGWREWIDLPDMTLPSLPDVMLVDFALPDVKWPDITWPDIARPQWDTPAILQTMTGKISGWMETLSNALTRRDAQRSSVILSDAELKEILSIVPEAGSENSYKLAEKGVLFQTEPSQITAQSAASAQQKQPVFKYEIEDEELDVEGVLVPQKSTVISSSKDGKIMAIPFDNGDMFRKGDILVEYECKDLKAELEIAQAEKDFSAKRTLRHEKLLNLDIISDIEHLGIKTEDIKAEGQARIIESRLEQCYIRAAYDGRVTNRLANPFEYTRSDRVLMEVASLDDLEIEFLLPSRWLRWVNIGAPLTLTIAETGERYHAVIQRIHGEVDPVSQSIQISAKLDPYDTPLLPGMSGNVHIDLSAIRGAGIKGFLEEPRYSRNDTAPDHP